MFRGYPNGVTTEEIEDGFYRVRIVSGLQLVAGTLALVCGIVALYYGWPNIDIPLSVAAGVWTGCIVVASAMCGMIATCMLISLYNKHIKNLLVAQWVLAYISLPCSCLYLGLSAWAYVACSGNGNFPNWCYPNNHETVDAAIANMVAGALLVVFTFPVLILFCPLMRLYKDLPDDVDDSYA